MENSLEQGGDRTYFAHVIDRYYRDEYQAIFGPLPDLSDLPLHAGPNNNTFHSEWESMTPNQQQVVTHVAVNIGKSIAAYERTLKPYPSPFDRYVEAVVKGDQKTADEALSPDAVAGLRLFIGKADCVKCHSGPLFTDHTFHNIGVPAAFDQPQEAGRAWGVGRLALDEFGCLSPYSDADPNQCESVTSPNPEDPTLVGQFKTPSLRNVAERAPYGHSGQFATLEDVMHYLNTAPDASIGHSELHPLSLTEQEIAQLIAFLQTLTQD
jgi:cytochrome c peroxidase